MLHQRLHIDVKSEVHDLIKFTEKVNENKVGTFVYDQTSRRFKVKIPNGTAIKLSPTLSWKLGYTSNCSPEGCTLLENGATATHFPILHREVHELYIYSNIIENAYVGDIKAPLLLVCPFKKSNDALAHTQFQNPTYKLLNRNSVQQIEIAIYDAFGNLVNFKHGRTIVNLHFRKVSQ